MFGELSIPAEGDLKTALFLLGHVFLLLLSFFSLTNQHLYGVGHMSLNACVHTWLNTH